MDIAAVENSLNRKVVSPVYLFYGEETYLRDQLVEKFKEQLLPIDLRDFNLDILDGRETSLENVLSAASTLPFLAEKRLVIVYNADFFKSKKKNNPDQQEEKPDASLEEPLLRYLENPSTDTCLIFLADEGVNKQKKIYKALEKTGQVVNFPMLKSQDLPKWILDTVRQSGREIAPEAVRYVAMAVGSNLRLLTQELEKLLTRLGAEQEITLPLVEEMISKQVDITVFQLVDAVAEKRFPAAMEYSHDLIFQGEPPIRIINLITRQFRLLWLTKLYCEQGYRDAEVASKLQVKSFVVGKCIKQGRNFRQENLRQAFRILLETDYQIKTGQQEAVVGLEMALMKLCS